MSLHSLVGHVQNEQTFRHTLGGQRSGGGDHDSVASGTAMPGILGERFFALDLTTTALCACTALL